MSLIHRGQHRYEAGMAVRRFALELIEIDAHAVRFSCDGVTESAVYTRDGSWVAAPCLHLRLHAKNKKGPSNAARPLVPPLVGPE